MNIWQELKKKILSIKRPWELENKSGILEKKMEVDGGSNGEKRERILGSKANE